MASLINSLVLVESDSVASGLATPVTSDDDLAVLTLPDPAPDTLPLPCPRGQGDGDGD